MTKNVAASVRQRLLNLARKRNEDFGLVLTKYALERLLYRLCQSQYKEIFILKGALLFEVWTKERHRPTRDLDLLASESNSVEHFIGVFQEICAITFEEDGLHFEAEKAKGERIREDANYEGVRLQFKAHLGTIRIPVQIDIGLGDAITPAPIKVEYPTLLPFPVPCLLACTKETVIAEKCEAMVQLGIANSRMKDFYDIWSVLNLFDFTGETLSQAIKATFLRRKTELPKGRPIAFTEEFYSDRSKRQQWSGFVQRNNLQIEQKELPEIVISVASFLMPVLEALSNERDFYHIWRAGGPWLA